MAVKGQLLMIALNFEKMNGLLPAIAQDHDTGEVLMLAFMNQAAWQKTLASGYATYYSRTRDTLWTKGETSGHQQIVKEIRIDCDNDTVLLKVEQRGGATCHTGHRSCFFQVLEDGGLRVDGEPLFDPKEVYRK
jgi:phosphoribosyl-AMP cyclohydrolase